MGKTTKISRLLSWVKAHWKEITIARILNYFGAIWRSHNQTDLKQEQFLWRTNMVTKRSPKCLEGQCIHCGCDTPDKFWESAACEFGCYPQWKDPQEWADYKKALDEEIAKTQQ